MATNFPLADTTGVITGPAVPFYGGTGTLPDTLNANNVNVSQNIHDAVAAISASHVLDPSNTVNALGVKSTTGTLKYGTNTVTGTSSQALVLTLPTAVAGARVICVFTNAASTGVTSLTFTGMKNAGGTEFACTATASAIDVFGFVSDGTNWYGWFSNKNVS